MFFPSKETFHQFHVFFFLDFQCNYCEKVYAHRGDLTKHLRTHIGELIYECDICPKKFRLPRELKLHSFEHYKEEKERMSGTTSTNMETGS